MAEPTRALSSAEPSLRGIDPASVTIALFRVVLGREPDEKELDAYVYKLRAGAAIEGVIKDTLAGLKTRGALRDFVERNNMVKPGHIMLDYSEYGELQQVLTRVLRRSVVNPLIVDVGAYGRRISNSYDLMRTFGWKGLLIEANPALAAAIERDFAGADFKLVQCAVADYEGAATFTLSPEPGVSSLLSEQVAKWGPIVGNVEVSVRRLPNVLEANDIPHEFGVLSIDIEGLDVAVVNDLIGNSPYRPTWMIIEVRDAWRLEDLAEAGFSEAVRREYEIAGRTLANLILEKRPA